ncbi:murein biosynthesis integral membrane protein MurJ [Candidatus Synchoanobacter obligatus]|uniref:Lipid II flippase n=1 Tax=Candidatus Synchoanobacter obligatus TaxID=2919597 RepID=A0ABT1L657_9GAMM|nr:murein biosynthesis integral membrane protein MurJ [Candidatus Synchoanobacter obligatus]MCP8352353.1 murein biosynthesis integral membrane protein MurJ [Candidatus Synchoanobacter obligatus]
MPKSGLLSLDLMMLRMVLNNALITLLSRVLGFVRDVSMAQVMGASWHMDVFLIVFKLPNFFRRLLAEGAFTQALVPAGIRAKDREFFFQQAYGWLWVVIFLLSFPFMCFPDKVLKVFVYGLAESSQQYQLAVRLLPWVFPYLGCMACCGFYTVQLNIAKHFFIGSFLPVLLNSCLIMACYYYSFFESLWYFGYAVLLAGILQVILCAYATWRIGGVLLPGLPRASGEIQSALKQVSIGFSAQLLSYVSSVFDLLLVSYLATGSLSWLYYSERLMLLPVGVIGVVLANILLPKLSVLCQKKDYQGACNILQAGLFWVILIGVPVMMGGLIMGDEIVMVLFSSPEFTAYDVTSTAMVLNVFMLGLPAYMLNRVWGGVSYALLEPSRQLRISAICTSVGIMVSIMLLPLYGHIAIAIGSMVSAWLNSGLLWQYIRDRLGFRFLGCEQVYQILIAVLAMVLCVFFLNHYVVVEVLPNQMGRILMLMIKIVLAAAGYFGVLYMQKTKLSLFF